MPNSPQAKLEKLEGIFIRQRRSFVERGGIFVFRVLMVHVVDRVFNDMICVLIDEVAYINSIDALKLLDIFHDGKTGGNHDIAHEVLVVELAVFPLHGALSRRPWPVRRLFQWFFRQIHAHVNSVRLGVQ